MVKPVSYLQTDPKWSGIDYSAKGELTTIGKSGCGPSCMAMVLSTYTASKPTPKDTCNWALSHGFKAPNQGTYYSYFTPQGKEYGLEVVQLNGANLRGLSSAVAKPYHAKVVQAIKNGDLVICCMGEGLWTKSGHFILLYGIEGNTAFINDPNSTAPNRVNGDLARLQKEVKYYFICKKPTTSIKTHSENYYAVQKKYDFGSEFMNYMDAYQYAEGFYALALMDVNHRKFQINTISYILDYKHGVEALKKLAQ